MTTEEKLARGKALGAEYRTILAKGDKMTEADLTRANLILDEVVSLDAQVRMAENLSLIDNFGSHRSSQPAQVRTAARPPRSQPARPTDRAQSDGEKRAFKQWMRTGQVTAEMRDLGISTPAGAITGGSVFVPQGFDPALHSALKSFGELVSAVRTLRTDTGEPIKVALDSDFGHGLQLVVEAGTPSETDPLVSGFVSAVDELSTGLILVTNQLLSDSQFDVNDWITSKLGRRYFDGLAKFVAQGNGSNIAKLTPSVTVAGSVGETNAITLDNVTDVFGSLDPAYQENASWVMTNSTKVSLMKLKDNYGHSLLQPDATGKPFNAIYGRPIVISPYTDQLGAGNIPLLFGDLQASYTLRYVGGLEVARSTEYRFAQNETAFVGWARIGGYNTSQESSPSLVGFQNAAS